MKMLRKACLAAKYVLLILTVVGCATSAGPNANHNAVDSVTVGMPAPALPSFAALPFSSKVNPADVRFAIGNANTIYVELLYDKDSAPEAFRNKFPDFAEYGFGIPLSDEQQRFVLERVPERIGDRFSVYFPGTGNDVIGTLTRVTCYQEGMSGELGFSGVLDIPAALPIDKDDVGGQTVGIAFHSVSRIKSKRTAIMPVSFATCDAIRSLLEQHTGKRFLNLPRAARSPLDNSILAIALIGTDDWLYYFVEESGVLRIVPLSACEGEEGLLIEERGPGHCGYMSNTSVSILPDLNGDGRNEIFVNTTTCYILSPVSAHDAEKGGATNQIAVLRRYH